MPGTPSSGACHARGYRRNSRELHVSRVACARRLCVRRGVFIYGHLPWRLKFKHHWPGSVVCVLESMRYIPNTFKPSKPFIPTLTPANWQAYFSALPGAVGSVLSSLPSPCDLYSALINPALKVSPAPTVSSTWENQEHVAPVGAMECPSTAQASVR